MWEVLVHHNLLLTVATSLLPSISFHWICLSKERFISKHLHTHDVSHLIVFSNQCIGIKVLSPWLSLVVHPIHLVSSAQRQDHWLHAALCHNFNGLLCLWEANIPSLAKLLIWSDRQMSLIGNAIFVTGLTLATPAVLDMEASASTDPVDASCTVCGGAVIKKKMVLPEV